MPHRYFPYLAHKLKSSDLDKSLNLFLNALPFTPEFWRIEN